MALDEPNDEHKHTINEIDILMSEEVLPHTNGNRLDFVSDARGEGFVLAPINGSSCGDGCGDDDCGDGDCCC